MIHIVFLVFFLAICLLLIYEIRIGFAVAVASVILVLPIVRLKVGFIDVTFFNAITFSVWGTFILHVLMGKIPKLKFNRKIYALPILYFFILNILVIPLSLTTISVSAQLRFIFFYFFMPLSYCYIAWHIYRDEKDIKKIVTVLLITSLITTIYGLYCYFTISNPFITLLELNFETIDTTRGALSRMEEARGGLLGRTQSTMYHAITWGGVCMILLVFFANKNMKVNRILKLILCSLLCVNMMFSGTRSALVATFSFLAIFFILTGIKYKVRILRYAAICVLSAIFILPFTGLYEKYEGLIDSTFYFWDENVAKVRGVRGSSVSMRIEQFEGAVDMAKESPIAGLGHGYISDYKEKNGLHPVLLGFESIVFQKIVENGLLGVIIWTFFFYTLYNIPSKVKKISKDSTPVAFIKSYLFCYFVFAVFTSFMGTFLLFLIIYTILLKMTVVTDSYSELSKTS